MRANNQVQTDKQPKSEWKTGTDRDTGINKQESTNIFQANRLKLSIDR